MAINPREQQGFGIIELLVTIFIITVALFSLFELYNLFLKTAEENEKYAQAVFSAQEALEAARSVRDENWSNVSGLSDGAPYYPARTGLPEKWVLNSGQEVVNGFSRQLVFEKVMRDSGDNIVGSGGTDDPGTRKVAATVSWTDRGKNYNVKLVTYLTDWRL